MSDDNDMPEEMNDLTFEDFIHIREFLKQRRPIISKTSTSSKDADGTEDDTSEAVESEKDGDEASGKEDGAFYWKEKTTLLMIELYKQNESKLADPKFKKKHVWTLIAEGLKKRHLIQQ